MLTIFSTCKPFRGNIAIIQRNAIKSWTLLGPDVEVILLGDDEGTAEVARDLGVRHLPDVDKSEMGTPLMDSIFKKAQAAASHLLMAYVNADIILMSDFRRAVARISKSRFLLLGPRWDLEVTEELEFKSPRWQEDLMSRVHSEGLLHPPGGIDYFVFPRGFYDNIPPFALGRQVWASWLVYEARARRAPVIDAGPVMTAVHQNHDYAHLPEGEKSAQSGPEVLKNFSLVPRWMDTFDLLDATWRLTERGLKPVLEPHLVGRRVYTESLIHPWLNMPLAPMRAVTRALGAVKQHASR